MNKLSMNLSFVHVHAWTVLATCLAVASCVSMTSRPTLEEVRLGNARAESAINVAVQPGEIQAEVAGMDRSRRNIHVIAEDGRRHALPYDVEDTRLLYHGREYTVDKLEAGDRIAYRSLPHDKNYIEVIRILEPVQVRTSPPMARSAGSSRLKHDVVEGTVERIDHARGLFDLNSRTGRTVTVSVPYNATTADIDYFRSLRRGDHVRVEGEFINPESVQLLAFIPEPNR